MGSNCPPSVWSEPGSECFPKQQITDQTKNSRQIDLGIIAPTLSELRQRGWLARSLRIQATYLAPDGFIYLLLPPAYRQLAIRQLERTGLVLDSMYWHLPHLQSSRYLVPLCKPAIDYTLQKLLTISPWKRQLLNAALRTPGNTMAFSWLPSVAMVARRPGAAKLFHWLTEAGARALPAAKVNHVILATSWRNSHGAVTFHGLAPKAASSNREERLIWVAKTRFVQTNGERHLAEDARLDLLGPTARQAGAHVPQPLASLHVGNQQLFFQSAQEGIPLVTELRSNSVNLARIIDSIGAWLLSWNRLSVQSVVVDSAILEKIVWRPAMSLSRYLSQPQEYLKWLNERFSRLIGRSVPFVAAHNDLTMWNVLGNRQGQLSIVDWEEASLSALPLMDFFYAVTDAAAAANNYVDRLGAYQSCFAPYGKYFGIVVQWQERIQNALGISNEVALLSSHACWLHHAVNESLNEASSEETVAPKPFLEIVRWVVDKQSC